MGDKNPIRCLGNYSKPRHEGYRNTIKLLEGNNMVPLRSDTIQLVQNGCSFHKLRTIDETKSYPVGIVKDVEVYIGKLKLLNDFYVIDMKKDPETPLLVGRGFLATANVVIDCRMVKIAVGEGITSSNGVGAQIPYYVRKDFLDCHLPGEWEIAKDAKINPFKDVLVFRRMVEFLGAIPINLKSNIWESKDLINNPINFNKPPKNRDGAWHAKIRLIDPDEEEFTKTLQSIPVPTTRKLSERESPREIIDLDHFYDTERTSIEH
uniref:MAK10-like protein n=1 Tax=Tanacetum cinerariifolium TaxID=118510 RepID=A0A699HWC3_TANCI|nr:MAK10-like protein [Tanacetum cinerariifolium]